MRIGRWLGVVLGVVSIVGCASMGRSAVRTADDHSVTSAEDELALLRLAERVEAAAGEDR